MATPACHSATDASPADPADLPRTRRQRLGPVFLVGRLRRPIVGRFYALIIATACAALLGFAATLHPDRHGYGTHLQTGLPTCAFLVQTGYPCPTCGMTTAFADLVHGRPIRSFLDQPAGFALALATAALGALALAVAISGRAVRINWYRVNPVRLVWAFVILFVGSWAFKIVHGLAVGLLPAR